MSLLRRLSVTVLFCLSGVLYCYPSFAIDSAAFPDWATERLTERDPTELLISAAEEGDSEAQFQLGCDCYWKEFFSKPKGNDADYAEAMKWYKKAGKQGHADAQERLGDMYYRGEGVAKNYAEAMKWYRKTAEQGNLRAQKKLAEIFFKGDGVPKNYTEALKWYQKAAEQGDDEAQYETAFMHLRGQGGRKNYGEAARWFAVIARQAEDGRLYSKYYGPDAFVTRDQIGAAESRVMSSEFILGLMYRNGEGVTKNYAEAMKWYRKAAEQGHADAQLNLGLMYFDGEGVPKNNVEGYKWVNLATASGQENTTKARSLVERRMTPGQIAEAQRLSANWQPKSSSDPGESRTLPDNTKPPPPQTGEQSQVQAGTAFVVSSRGHVLTNYHVIEGCTKIACDLGGKATVLALVHADSRNDLALLKLESPAAPPLNFRDGKSIRSGDGIVVLGFPLQQMLANQAHVTTGTVSAMAGPGNDTRILQITAPVQPGNSGGPVLDMAGNVVGVATAKLNAIKTAQLTGDLPQNVNFAINAAVIKAFLDANGVDYETSISAKRLEASEIGELARKATLFIVCSK